MVTRKVIKLIRSLHQKKYRHQHQLFLVEGAKSVQELLLSDFRIETLVATKVFLQQHQGLLSSPPDDRQYYEADEATLSSLSTFKHNNAALAVATIPSSAPPSLAPSAYVLALDDIRDPGNLGTIIRIADWYGIQQIICSPATTDAYAPKVISASMGSFSRVPVVYTALDAYLSQLEVPVYGAVLDEGQSVHQLTIPANGGAILLGNESEGISTDLMPYITEPIHIPRFGQAESLNVGIATAVICDNMMRSRGVS